MSWPVSPDKLEGDMNEFDKELVSATGHIATANCAQGPFMPIEMCIGDEKVHGFAFGNNTHLLSSGTAALVNPLKRGIEEEICDEDLSLCLRPHKFGQMVAVEDYEPLLDDALTYMPFRDQSKTIPRKLQGCIIQSRKDVLLCLKVEVYGRSPDEDPQAIPDLVTPDVRSFKVVNELFGGANQVMIGTSTWNALVTMTVILNHGEVIVGPNNVLFYPHAASHLWLRKSGEKFFHNNHQHQTSSHFDNEITYMNHAAIHPRFVRFNTQPATLATLWKFKHDAKGWSGVKLAALIFHTIYLDEELKKRK
ncbi:MAG: hypothetical protein J3Q66DRAFT_408150 [Benniella sp.]|nr:MAG: hypothetical protein J3Q66DRAFT_408150 [Benniella sp.]